MLPMRTLRPLLIGTFLLFCCSPASAQGKKQRAAADSLRAVITELGERIARADSTGDTQARIALRTDLAALLRPKDGVKVLERACAIADSALAPERYGLRRTLAWAKAGAGDHRHAYEVLDATVGALLEEDSMRAVRADQRLDSVEQRARSERDSVGLAWQQAMNEATKAGSRMQERAARWMWIAIGALALAVIAVALLFARLRSVQKRNEAAVKALKAEVALLSKPVGNRYREPVKEPVVPATASPVVPVVAKPPVVLEVPSALDPMVLGLFQKRAPERLATLREARLAGDAEKVLRVLHTLKPQLVALDADGAGALCAGLAAAGTMPIDADLDRLERAMEQLMAAR